MFKSPSVAQVSPIRVPEHVILFRFINNTKRLCMCPGFDFRLLGLFDDTYVPVIWKKSQWLISIMFYDSTIAGGGLWNQDFHFKQNIGFTAVFWSFFPLSKPNSTLAASLEPQILLLCWSGGTPMWLRRVVSPGNHLCPFKPKVIAGIEKVFIINNPQVYNSRDSNLNSEPPEGSKSHPEVSSHLWKGESGLQPPCLPQRRLCTSCSAHWLPLSRLESWGMDCPQTGPKPPWTVPGAIVNSSMEQLRSIIPFLTGL